MKFTPASRDLVVGPEVNHLTPLGRFHVVDCGILRIPRTAFDGGGATTSMGAGDRAVLAFTGTAVRWIAYRDGWSGLANVYLDGALRATIDTFSSPPQARGVVWEAAGLPDGGHTLTIEVAGSHDA